MNNIAFLLIFSLNLPFLSEDRQSLNSLQEECFAVSMIGYDYVINSRAGLPIERALNTVAVDKSSDAIQDTYKYYLKSVVRNAYQWLGEPHLYAVKVMHACAFNQGISKN